MKQVKRTRRDFDRLAAWGMAVFALHGLIFGTGMELIESLKFSGLSTDDYLGRTFTAIITGMFASVPVAALNALAGAAILNQIIKRDRRNMSRHNLSLISAAIAVVINAVCVIILYPHVDVPAYIFKYLEFVGVLHIVGASVFGYVAGWLGTRSVMLASCDVIEASDKKWWPKNFSYLAGWVVGLQIIQGIVFGSWVQVTRFFGQPGERNAKFIAVVIERSIISSTLCALMGAFLGLAIAILSAPLIARSRTRNARLVSALLGAGFGLAVIVFMTRVYIDGVYINPADEWKLRFVGVINTIVAGANTFWGLWKGTGKILLDGPEPSLDEIWQSTSSDFYAVSPIQRAAYKPILGPSMLKPGKRKPVPSEQRYGVTTDRVVKRAADKTIRRERPLEAPIRRRRP